MINPTKALEKAVQETLSKFVGQVNDEFVRESIRNDMVFVLYSFAEVMGVKLALPEVNVELNGKDAIITLTDPKTGETISVSDWSLRSLEGFYD